MSATVLNFGCRLNVVESEAIREVILGQRTCLQEQCRGLAGDVFGKSRSRDGDMIERLLLDR